MNITVIGVTKANLMEVITDDSVYVIKRNLFNKNRFVMEPIAEADVKDLLSGDVIIVKVTKECKEEL